MEITIVCWGYWDNGKENGNYMKVLWHIGVIGIMEKKMETTRTGVLVFVLLESFLVD